MKQASLFSRFFAFTILCCAFHALSANAQQQVPLNNASPLRVTVSLVPDGKYTSSSIPLRVTFENTGKEPLTLLKPLTNKEAFFTIRLKMPDGKIVSTPHLVLVDFGKSSLRYVSLEENETYGVKLNVRDVDEDNSISVLEPGDYQLTLEYHNQYGDNCFHGHANATQTLEVHLTTKNALIPR